MADPSLVLDLVGKAWDIIQMGLQHKSTLENLKSTMKELVPVVEQIKNCSKTMDLDAEEIAKLMAMMEATQEVIHNCSDVRWWNCCLLPYYKTKLDEADKSFVRYISVQLQMQMARDLRIICSKLSSDDSRTAQTIHDHEIPVKSSSTGNLFLDTASFSPSSKKYDVFISFRGEDTRTNFASYLYAALSDKDIKTYGDYRPKKGEEAWPSVEKVIEDSALFVVIFSENYASSTSCLNELTKILECSKDQAKGHLVLPVFYKIEPTHVRKQTGSYQIAFAKHEHKYQAKQVQKWRAALTQAANVPGWDYSAYRFHADLIQDIVKGVMEKLHMVPKDLGNNSSRGLVSRRKRLSVQRLCLALFTGNICSKLNLRKA